MPGARLAAIDVVGLGEPPRDLGCELRRSVPAVTQVFRPRAFERAISWTGS